MPTWFPKLYRNKIYQTVAESNLDPAECNFTVNDGEARIDHSSGSFFSLSEQVNDHGYVYHGVSIVEDGQIRIYNTERNIDLMLTPIKDWANEVQMVVETPDYWTEMQSSQALVAQIQRSDSDNTPFTQDEQEQIIALLHEIRNQLKARFELTAEQIARIDEKVDDVIDAVKHMRRKDWFIYFLGTITALVITSTVPAGVGEHIFNMVIQGIAHLFLGGGGPPRILA